MLRIAAAPSPHEQSKGAEDISHRRETGWVQVTLDSQKRNVALCLLKYDSYTDILPELLRSYFQGTGSARNLVCLGIHSYLPVSDQHEGGNSKLKLVDT